LHNATKYVKIKKYFRLANGVIKNAQGKKAKKNKAHTNNINQNG
jgi:hypothetical protein